MNKYTTLLQKYLKRVVFGTLVLSLFFIFTHTFKASANLQKTTTLNPTVFKTEFFTAMQQHDLAKARAAHEQLVALLPADDPFLKEIAPAYMADLYLKYAQTLSFDDKAHRLMLAQAEQLSPKHPLLLVMKAALPVEEIPLPEPEVIQLQVQEHIETETPLETQTQLIETPIEIEEVLLTQTPPIQDGPPRIPYIDPPPLDFSQSMTSDPCALSFLTKSNALTACIDPVSANRYGPAMFVVADPRNMRMLAFTQQAITHQDYDLFCEATGQCSEENQETKALIDLSDVEEAVHDYNAYCQMTGSCDKITSKQAKPRNPLTRDQVQRYALWLSKQTGYEYHLPNEEDTTSIALYFQECVQAKVCHKEVLNNLSGVFSQQDTLLVREVMKR